MKKIYSLCISAAAGIIAFTANAQGVEYLNYGNFNNWVTRNIHESSVIGGNSKTLYEIGPCNPHDVIL